MKIWNVPVDFNVEADTQSQAADKMAAFLRKYLAGPYESIGEPVLQTRVSAKDCENLIS